MRDPCCPLCGFPRPGEHEPWCPHFMRGPDQGGDPAEWETLFPDDMRLEDDARPA